MVRKPGAKRIWATQDGALWRINQFANSDVPFVRADIADGYRAALERIEQNCTGGAVSIAREALAKGDEGIPPAQAENETKG